MHQVAVECSFATRGALRSALIDSFPEGGIFVEGEYGVTSGTPIAVRVVAEGMGVGTYIEGVVQWRRFGTRQPGVPPGLGVRLMPSERGKYAFLEGWAREAFESSGRSEWRYPCELSVQVQSTGATRATARILHCTVRDASLHGAMLALPIHISAAESLVLSLQRDGALYTFDARVAWSHDTRAGVRLQTDKKEDRAVWAQVVALAREAVEQLTVTARAGSIRPAAMDR